MKKGKHEIKYNKVVNIDKETNEIQVLDYVFNRGDNFHGATGSRFEPVSKKEYRERMKKENVIDSLIDSGLIEIEYNHNQEIKEKMQRASALVLYDAMKEANELESFCFDLSYQDTMWNELRKYGYPANQFPVFNCSGGGRMFDNKFKGNVNPELSKVICEYETHKKK